MFSIFYLLYFIKTIFPYFKLKIFEVINNANKVFEYIVSKKYFFPEILSIIFPFIFYRIYTFYEQG